MTRPASGKGTFSVLALIALVIGNMVGAGVFTTSGFALADLGSPFWVLLAWLVGGVIALCGAAAYGALVREVRASGGEYVFLARLVHPAAGFVAGWVSLLAGFTGAIALAALTFEAYLLPTPPEWFGKGTVAMATIILCAMLHAGRVALGARFQVAIVILKMLALAGFVLLAIAAIPDSQRWLGWQQRSSAPFSILAFAGSLMWISLSYAGFNAAVYVAGEVEDADRRVPRAMLIGTLLVTVFYLLLNAVFLLAPAPDMILGKPDVALQAAQQLAGDWGRQTLQFIIALALLTSVSAMVIAGPRVYARMADDGLFPRILGGAPTVAILVQALLACLVVAASSLRELLSYLGFTLSLCGALAVGSLFRSSLKASPWRKLAAVVYVLATLVTTTLGAIRQPKEGIAGMITLASGLALYAVIKRRKHS